MQFEPGITLTLTQYYWQSNFDLDSVADPGFPVGGHQPRRGVPTPEAATFQKICMSKQKNLDP